MKCYDCQTSIKAKKEKLLNGVCLQYKDEKKDYWVYKCHECFEKNPALMKFQLCEVYSRIVGYMRPIEGWNKGKQQEYQERKTYKMKTQTHSL